MYICINTDIFPTVMGITIKEKETGSTYSIDLPSGANLLYLDNIKDNVELRLLKKYASNEQFNDIEIKTILKYFLNNTVRPTINTNNKNDYEHHLSIHGIQEKEGQFIIADGWLPYLKKLTWEYITIDLLKELYLPSIKEYDFGNIDINLWDWRTASDKIEQSLLYSFRSAFMFTLIGYLYGDKNSSYNSFREFFTFEYSKRIKFISGLWKSKRPDEEIKYIPIFDSFYNLKGLTEQELIEIVMSILENQEINEEDKNLIKVTLISGAEIFHKEMSPERIALEQSLIKPVVNFIGEITSAEDDLKAAEILHAQKLYDQAINRSYYSMMHALKALLEKNRMLSEWDYGKLNVTEAHRELEYKLKILVNQEIISREYLNEFKSVKKDRWIADYNLSKKIEVESIDCLKKANKFFLEVKRLTK